MFSVSAKTYPVPLPPWAPRTTVPPGAVVDETGAIRTPPPTATLAATVFPRESVAVISSVTLGVRPA